MWWGGCCLASEWVWAETEKVRVGVATEYQVVYSNPTQNHFVFAYTVKIENNSNFTLQLMRRHWFIYDSISSAVSEVEGEGVVGEQPILEPNDQHQYVSGCHLQSYQGKMKGTYLMKRFADQSEFKITIPEFQMVVPKMFR